jgi:ribosomal protein L28
MRLSFEIVGVCGKSDEFGNAGIHRRRRRRRKKLKYSKLKFLANLIDFQYPVLSGGKSVNLVLGGR